jgi:hypothetical protein
MAIEGTETVEKPGGTSTTGDVEKPAGEQQVEKPAGGGSGTPPDKSGEYDRQIKGLTSDLQKERLARQRYDADLKAARAELEAEKKRVQALAGVNPKSAEETETEAIRQRFAILYPHLADLTAEDIQAIREQRGIATNLNETTQHYWVQHGRQMVGSVISEIEKELGGKLTERQAKRIAAEYAREAENNPEFLERHEKGDKTLVAEFAKQLSEDWFEPARRKVTQQESQRFRAVPDSKGRGIVTQGEKKIDVNDPKAVEDFLVKGYRERNGEFTGRH